MHGAKPGDESRLEVAGGERMDLELDLIEFDAPEVGVDEGRLRALVPFVLAEEGQTGAWAVTIVLSDDRRLRGLHRDFMGIDETTDVMTFPLGDEDGPRGGEIVVSVERAIEQGPQHGLDAAREVEFLIVHGLLHLCGWDDPEPTARQGMHLRQTELLETFDRSFGRPSTAHGAED